MSDAPLKPLVLVVGPSGVGKDSLLAGARQRLAGDARFHFARRVITRPAQPEAEDHDSLSEAAFAAAEAGGRFMLSWRAHGLSYGVPWQLHDLRRQAVVAANVSRAVIDQARAELAPVVVLAITAPLPLRAARLARRGRETSADIEARLARDAALPEGDDVITVVNDHSLEAGIAAVTAALLGVAG